MATPERVNTTGTRSPWARQPPLPTPPRTITTLEHLIGGLQDAIGPEDPVIVAATYHVLSVSKATFLNATVWRDMAVLDAWCTASDFPPQKGVGATLAVIRPRKGGDQEQLL
jgi:hypothetical protein